MEVTFPPMPEMSERTEALFGLWDQVNRIAATTEDSQRIRAMIAEAGIKPGMHVGRRVEEFTPEVVAEWVLGQWADMIDSGAPFLNTARNVSIHQWEQATGQKFQTPKSEGPPTKSWFGDELAAVTDRLGKPS